MTLPKTAIKPTPRTIWMDGDTREALKEYAWGRRTTTSEMLRASVLDVKRNPTRTSELSDDDCASSLKVSLKISLDDWTAATLAASKGPTDLGKPSLASLVRRRIRFVLKAEGYLS